MSDDFDRLVADLAECVARTANQKVAHELIGRFSADVKELRPNKGTAFLALAMLVRSVVPEDESQIVWLTALARAVADFEIVRHPDGSPVYQGETPGVLQ